MWHGSADLTVNPANADEIVKQWLDVHGLPAAPMAEAKVDGYPRQVWWNADGETLVESYTISGMAHGTPLGVADNDERYGVEGAFLIEAGISSSYHIAKFFGLTRRVHQSSAQAEAAAAKTMLHAAARERAKPFPTVAPVTLQGPDLATTLWPRATLVQPARRRPSRGAPASISAVSSPAHSLRQGSSGNRCRAGSPRARRHVGMNGFVGLCGFVDQLDRRRPRPRRRRQPAGFSRCNA